MSYQCADCQKVGVKLWRKYMVIGSELLCCDCAAGKAKPPIRIEDIDKEGRYFDNTEPVGMTSEIGWYIPAILVENEQNVFWGYTSVPNDALLKWRELPNR